MGGDLTKAPSGKTPTFMVAALKDPIGANLDRIQVIKGWLDSKGETHEKVYDVVWSGDRKPDAKGKLPPVGDTVDVQNATYSNSIGASELIKVWKDPEFDPSQRAFYYVRVLEIPTPRWTAYDASIPLALGFFSAGVEIGHFSFVIVAFLLLARTRRWLATLPDWSWRIPPYAIGTTASFWLIARLAAF